MLVVQLDKHGINEQPKYTALFGDIFLIAINPLVRQADLVWNRFVVW